MKETIKIHKYTENMGYRTISFLVAAVMLMGGVLWLIPTTRAAIPDNGTLTPGTTNTVTWRGDKLGGAAPNGEADCAPNAQTGLASTVCDTYKLTLTGDFTNKRARVQINWVSPTTDYDLYIHKGSPDGTIVASSATGTTTFEQADIDVNSNGVGDYYVRVVYFAATSADQYNGIAMVVDVPAPYVPPASSCALSPTYQNYKPPCNPENFATCNTFPGYNTAGEPSLGVNWNTGNVLFQSNLFTLRATFNDAVSPATAIWASKQGLDQQESLDPIMFTDPMTGRTIPGQLLAALGASATAISDNDAESFTPNVSTGITSGNDHQTIGAGPYHAGTAVGPTTSYPNAWYYASQAVATATAARSDDGGLSYGPAVPMYNMVQCSGLHGHVKVAPDGTVYVPNKNCPDPDMNAATADGGQGFAVSENNGLTWTVRTLPGSGSGDNDPAVGIGAGGRVFFAYTSGNKHIHAAVTDDRGITFKYDQDIGVNVEIKPGSIGTITASVFPAAVGGDNNRAAIFFLGTGSTDPNDPTGTDGEPTGTGTNGTQDDFKGTWYPYIATTCDGGQSWSVVRAGDAVQQGVICTNGTTCPSGTRNLLDFNDLQVDRRGRPLAGYADGCVTARCLGLDPNTVTRTSNDKAKVATIIRQMGGPRLFADYDAGGPGVPTLPPPVQVAAVLKGNNLTWQTPDDNGSPLTGYKVYRGVGDGEPALIGEVGSNNLSFRDRRTARGAVYYQVTAVNGYGESPRTLKFFAGKTLLKGE